MRKFTSSIVIDLSLISIYFSAFKDRSQSWGLARCRRTTATAELRIEANSRIDKLQAADVTDFLSLPSLFIRSFKSHVRKLDESSTFIYELKAHETVKHCRVIQFTLFLALGGRAIRRIRAERRNLVQSVEICEGYPTVGVSTAT